MKTSEAPWPSAARPAARCWNRAVSVATPNTPPIIRIIERTPEAAPAFVRSTEAMVTTIAVVGDIIPPRDRGKYQGIFGAVFGVSTIVGPLLGGFFVDNLSWRWIFYVNLPIGIAAFLVIGAVFHDEEPHLVQAGDADARSGRWGERHQRHEARCEARDDSGASAHPGTLAARDVSRLRNS